MSEFEGDAPPIEPGPAVTPELFRVWRSPRLGAQNPERLTNPVWDWLVRSRASAYAASQRFGFGRGSDGGPGWSFARFGQSATTLDDGRVVYVAGEHEDHYDPDFYIYNDVVIRSPDDRIEIFGYPRDVFPPTDFHTATRRRRSHSRSSGTSAIRPIGGRGRRRWSSLELSTLSSSLIETGGDPPGWIHDHSASLDADGTIVVSGGKTETGRGAGLEFRENGDDWRLDLSTWRWERLTDRHWRQWQVSRGGSSFDASLARSLARPIPWRALGRRASREHGSDDQPAARGAAVGVWSGTRTSISSTTLFSPGTRSRADARQPREFGVHRIHVDGIVVRYIERANS